MDRVDEDAFILAGNALRMDDIGLLVEDRCPGGILHHFLEYLAPFGIALRLLCRIGDGISLGSAIVQCLVAIPGPVPATIDSATTTENRRVEVAGIREIGDPGHAARPDHRRAVFLATG